MIKIRQRDGIRNSDSTLILLAYEDSRGSFVQTNTESFELGFDDGFVSKGFEDVKDYENKVASSCDWR